MSKPKPFTAAQLRRLMKKFGIEEKTWIEDGQVVSGYCREDVEEAYRAMQNTPSGKH